MEILDKLNILSAAAKYDVSCSSSGSFRKNTTGGIGNGAPAGICHSWSDDGRCISLLKILITNYCCYDCVYCVNRVTNDVPRACFTPDEVVDLTINFYRRNYIEGLFLSSAIIRNADHTMEMLLQAVRKLRVEQRFNGYIHLKAIPGADWRLIAEAGRYVDRMSVNIELPSSQGLKQLAPQKNKDAIIKPMGLISQEIAAYQEKKSKKSKHIPFVPAGQSTQLIIGATPDHDLRIIKLSESLYRTFNLKRVYYSAYVPVSNSPKLPDILSPPLRRENRLYQADWLMRFYGFTADELLTQDKPDFDLDFDPKTYWALTNLHYFPVEVNKVDYQMLLRVPGIGVKSARRIISARRVSSLGYDELKKIGVVLKRARYFITCRGKYFGGVDMQEHIIRQELLSPRQKETSRWEQLSLFSDTQPSNALVGKEDKLTTVTGEL